MIPLARRTRPVGDGVLFFALLGGAAAWSLHLLASYPLVGAACALGGTALLVAVTLVTLAAAALAAGAGWSSWRRMARSSTGSDAARAPDSGRDRLRRARTMAWWGAVLSGFFTAVILLEGLPILLQDPCAYGP